MLWINKTTLISITQRPFFVYLVGDLLTNLSKLITIAASVKFCSNYMQSSKEHKDFNWIIAGVLLTNNVLTQDDLGLILVAILLIGLCFLLSYAAVNWKVWNSEKKTLFIITSSVVYLIGTIGVYTLHEGSSIKRETFRLEAEVANIEKRTVEPKQASIDSIITDAVDFSNRLYNDYFITTTQNTITVFLFCIILITLTALCIFITVDSDYRHAPEVLESDSYRQFWYFSIVAFLFVLLAPSLSVELNEVVTCGGVASAGANKGYFLKVHRVLQKNGYYKPAVAGGLFGGAICCYHQYNANAIARDANNVQIQALSMQAQKLDLQERVFQLSRAQHKLEQQQYNLAAEQHRLSQQAPVPKESNILESFSDPVQFVDCYYTFLMILVVVFTFVYTIPVFNKWYS